MFINTFIVRGRVFSDQAYAGEVCLQVSQGAEAVDKICTLHDVPLKSGHENVRFIISHDRNQF